MSEPKKQRTASMTSADQHQRDLEALSRIEHQRECFFDVMGELDGLAMCRNPN